MTKKNENEKAKVKEKKIKEYLWALSQACWFQNS